MDVKNIGKPNWLKVRLPGQGEFKNVRDVLDRYRLTTVCENARCPNQGECWSSKTATIMILGSECTRHCGFCAVKTGNPKGQLENDEPDRVAWAVKELDLKYVVLTSVDRDDLEDSGAGHYARAIETIKKLCPKVRVEALIPDFDAREGCLSKIVKTKPFVIGHNVETVERLTPVVRDRRATYNHSIRVLSVIKDFKPDLLTKSGIMVGLGETETEVIQTMKDLRNVGVDIFTLGQYLQPTYRNLPVEAFVTPEKFDWYYAEAKALGFKFVAAGPLVRSSYHAWKAVENL